MVVLPDAEPVAQDEGLWRVLCGCGAARVSRTHEELLGRLDGHRCSPQERPVPALAPALR